MTPTLPAIADRAPPRPWRRRGALASRVLAATAGSWLFAWGFVVLGIALGRRAGLPYEDAQTLARLVVFLVFVATACWAIAASSALRVWAVLAGGGVAMTGAGWWLLRASA